MLHNFFHVLGKCLWHKVFWCCLVTLSACPYLLYSHSFRACAVMLLAVLLGGFGMYEDYNETPESGQSVIHSPIRAQDC